LVILQDEASDSSVRELFNKLIFSEMQLLGRMLPLTFKDGARPTLTRISVTSKSNVNKGGLSPCGQFSSR
jgi:hypothetical protein